MSSQAGAYATDHSTILTNPMHAERALAYDVAVGVCRIKPDQLRRLRVAADWRLLGALNKTDPAKSFEEYFDKATRRKMTASVWINEAEEARLPEKIVDVRENPARDSRPTSGELAHD